MTLYYYLFLVLVIFSVVDLLPARALAHRPRLDGDPRGRDRRQGDGHQHAQPEAAGLRHGRHLRRRVRRDVRDASRASSRPSRSSLQESIMIVAMVVLGGIGHIPGVILGALLLAALPEVLRYVAGPLQDDDRRAPRRVDPAPAADRAGDDQHHAGRGRAACGPRPSTARPRRAAGRRTCKQRSAAMSDTVLKVAGVSKRFGGLQALSDVGITIQRGPGLRPDRPQRRRQDDLLQRAHRPVHARLRQLRARRQALQADRGARGGQGRHRAHLPEHPPVRRDDGARERDGRPPRAHPLGPARRDLPHRRASRPRKRRSPSARRNCSTTSASAASPTTRRAR